MRVNNSHRLLFDSGTAVPFLETPNKSGKLSGGKPKYVIIHYTAGGSGNSAINVFRNPAHKASAHFVLGHDGAITQMARLDEKCWHAGRSKWDGLVGLNSHSVGIEIANWGWLKGGNGNWKSHVGTRVEDARVIVARHRNGGALLGWEIFDEVQFMTCVDMVRAIADKYGLGPQHILGHDDISPGRKQDPGPAWHMDKFRALVFGRAEDDGDVEQLYRVESSSGLNMRKGAGTTFDVIKLLADGTQVLQIESDGAWWLVSEIVEGEPDVTGWVHSHWLRRI
ncbi:N-acetylmuramoyl-L-alanine amidase AmiD precursor [Roseovarius litorisediminis]|uniref:N-acetylmuramoyl-L-alanine amidase n=1 Tax=Roseovarius litorisediminis TaxID=1312363 RepID=A0A1Y5S6J6_9RHOB|nr:N-acetylmuramoyl-L-alanine amidase [Roseovarius litorisediminis]SLN33089.1 N-acetylmuramoyl-L-alanine amidase AmiD precursor [Roseovarius litorisediminis]